MCTWCWSGATDLYAFLDDYKDGCTEEVVRSVMRIAALGSAPLPRAGYCS